MPVDNKDTVQSLALGLALSIGETDGRWREVAIERDIANPSEKWVRWSSIVGWPDAIAARVDRYIESRRTAGRLP